MENFHFDIKEVCKEFTNLLDLKTIENIGLFRVQLKDSRWFCWTWFFHKNTNSCVLFSCFKKVSFDEFKKLILTGNSKLIDLDQEIKYITKIDKYLLSPVFCIELST